MAIYVFNNGNNKAVKFVYESLIKNNISRFGWSWFDGADLKKISKKQRNELTTEEVEVWKKTNFLNRVKRGDWVIHINVPSWGRCIAGKVSEPYFFEEKDNEISDFRHCLKIDPDSLIEFDRNDDNVHPLISRRLKLQGRYWTISAVKEFFETIDNLKNKRKIDKKLSSKEIFYLKEEVDPVFEEIACKIHKTHIGKNLEALICEAFKNVPGVIEATVNGSGWGTDFGADVIVKYSSGLDLSDLQKEELLVIQIKSFEGDHNDKHSIEQLETAFKTFEADCGLLITTGNSTELLEQMIDKLSQKLQKPVGLIAGKDVAKFLLKYDSGLLFDF